MKRIIVTLALAFSATFTFAASNVETVKIDNNNKNVQLTYPSGSGTITDACGNEYEIEWSCNYNCNGIDVINAIIAWGDDNTDCGFDSYGAD